MVQVMKSRAALDKDHPRTMQFLIQQACPSALAKGGRHPSEELVVDVYFERPHKHTWCGGVSFRTVGLSAKTSEGRVIILQGIDPTYTMYVCEHMGHLIE